MKEPDDKHDPGISATERRIVFREDASMPSRVVLLVFAGMLLAVTVACQMESFSLHAKLITWAVLGLPGLCLAFMALRRRIVSIDLQGGQIELSRGIVFPLLQSSHDLNEYDALKVDTSRVYKANPNDTKRSQTVTKKFILQGKKPCLLCRRGYGSDDKELESNILEAERNLQAALQDHLGKVT